MRKLGRSAGHRQVHESGRGNSPKVRTSGHREAIPTEKARDCGMGTRPCQRSFVELFSIHSAARPLAAKSHSSWGIILSGLNFTKRMLKSLRIGAAMLTTFGANMKQRTQ